MRETKGERCLSLEQAIANSYVTVLGKRVHKGWIMVLGCGLFQMAMVACIFSPIGLFYVAICDETGFLRSDISTWQQVHFLTTIIFMPISTKLLERYNARVVLTCVVLGCAVAAALMGVYSEPWQWCISGFLYGSFGALGTLQLAGPIVINNWFRRRNGVAMGVYGMIGAVAAVAAAPIFSLVIDSAGWRTAYFIQAAAIAVLGLTFTLGILRYRPSDIGALPYGVDSLEYIERETNADTAKERAKVQWKCSASLPFAMLFLFPGISSLIGSGFDAHISGHAVAEGFSTFFGAWCVSALSLGSGLDKILMGWLNDRIGVNKTVFVEYGMVIAGMLGLVFFKNPVLFLFAAFLFGVQDSFVSVSLPLLVRSHFGPEKMAQLMGWVSIGSGVFGSFGSRLVGYSYDATGSFEPAFLIGCSLCVFGVICLCIAEANRRKRIGSGEIEDWSCAQPKDE